MELTDWSAAWTTPDAITEPSALDAAGLEWLPFAAPGTVAAALAAVGQWSLDHDDLDFDGSDWWFRTRLAHPGAGVWTLRFGGLATIADIWCNGRHLGSSTNMFRVVTVDITQALSTDSEVVVRCAALRPLLSQRRQRPRWKTTLVDDQQLRWYRTSLHNRVPTWGVNAPIVGPWRPIELVAVPDFRFERELLRSSVDGSTGRVHLRGRVFGGSTATLFIDGEPTDLEVDANGLIDAVVEVAEAERWWPHTHGRPRVHPVELRLEGPNGRLDLDLGSVGFRTVEFGPADAPILRINDVDVFARGVCWNPVDPIGLNPTSELLRIALTQLRDAGMNMVRIQATSVYETADFHELCDELGIMVWQDLMFVRMDYPTDDEDFAAEVRAEVTDLLGDLGAHPSLSIVCGGCEIGQQAAMMGRLAKPEAIIGTFLADLVAVAAPDVAYLVDTPIGGTHPFTVNAGVTNYFGVGAYRRPASDATASGVRFASECLAFSTVPCDQTMEDLAADGVGLHDHRWKRAVVRDRGAPWDFEDIRDHYVRELAGVEPNELRLVDPERYLDLGRMAVAHVSAETFARWRVPTSTCGGGLILQGRDTRLGAGAGIIDAAGRPKATYFAVRRVLASRAVVMRDEGLNGLDVWVFNDGPTAVDGSLAIQAFSGEANVADAVESFVLDAHSARRFNAEALLGSFFDVTYAYRFGSEPLSAIAAQWHAGDRLVARAVHRPVLSPIERGDPGLTATVRVLNDECSEIEITSRGFAQSVMVDVGPAAVSDNGFDVEPGGTVRLEVRSAVPVRGRVRALNAVGSTPISEVAR